MMRRRVLIVTEPMEYGVLSHLERLFDGLDRRRWEPALVFSGSRMAPQASPFLARLGADGIRVRRVAFRRGLGPGDAAGTLALAREVRDFRPSLLHLHSTKAGLAGRMLARLLGVPALYTPHGTSWHYTGRLVGRAQLALERALRRVTALLLAVCPEEAAAFVREAGFPVERVRVVRNGVVVPAPAAIAASRARVRAALGLGAAETWAVFAGRLTPEKGVDVLLRALAGPTGLTGALVVGDGAARPALEAEAARLGVPVRFCGYHADVGPLLAAGDVFVQPSRSEGLPFAALEAMAHGLPVVASRVGGLAGLLDGCGRTVPPDDVGALRAALATLAADPAARARLGDAARARVAAEFGLPAMMAGVHAAYDEAAAGGSA
jgi:glycosyltransferase involved in cell wall biosynthesis